MDYKDIPFYPGYKISKEGEVIGKMGKPLRPYRGRVCLSREKKYLKRTLKSLLAETWFIDDWKNQLETGEEWKVIDGFDDYIITSKGRVWSKIIIDWMTPQNVERYYWKIALRRNGRAYSRKITTLVGRHFLPDYQQGLDILHKNEKLPFPEINWVDNLWVGTTQSNVDDMHLKERYSGYNQYGYVGVTHTGSNFGYNLHCFGKRISMSGFATALEAHEAYLAKRMEIKGF